MRVAHLVSYPIHYQAPLYRELASRPGIDLTVYFYSDASVRGYRDREFGRDVRWDTPLLDGYRSRFLPSSVRSAEQGPYGLAPNWDVLREVLTGGYDALWIHGYAHSNSWLAAAAGPFRGSRILIREEQTLLHDRPHHKAALKELALRALFSRVYGLYIGEQNRRYFLRYGMDEERLFPARYCVDNAYFRRRAEELGPRRDELRAGFGIDSDVPVILFAAKLIPKKAPLVLLEAFRRVRERVPCALLIVGEGELRPEIEAAAGPDVHLAGFLNQSELPAAYVAADVFCLPSVWHETWGLVVNEALNFGLPVVVSDKVGCSADLVRDGWNGFVVPAGEPGPLAVALEKLVADADLRRAFGERGRELVGEYSIEACADGIMAALYA
ncbi:MAG: glycosyltransferase family 4 protein [Actinobacteria bacterium]|nr:glycosyltransferase family 4 protein [Actinomycetota bacterium]